MDSHQLINQTTGNQEWGTPKEIVEAARRTMGSIDLDPATCAEANNTVMATCAFTKNDNGLDHPWFGNVWLNWPFGRKENPLWVYKLYQEWALGNAEQICCICYASTSETWFKLLKMFPICYLDGRTNYIDLNTGKQAKGVSKGSCVTYLGHNLSGFEEHFSPLGDVMWPSRYVDRSFFRRFYGSKVNQ